MNSTVIAVDLAKDVLDIAIAKASEHGHTVRILPAQYVSPPIDNATRRTQLIQKP